MYINEKEIETLDLLLAPEYEGSIERLIKEDESKALLACGSYGPGEHRPYSDYDLFLIFDGYKTGNTQVLHHMRNEKRLDIILFPEEMIKEEDSYSTRVLDYLLKDAKILYSEEEKTHKKLINHINNEKIENIEPTESEKQTMWYHFVWNLYKAKSYEGIDDEFADMVSTETYYMFGLFYAKLNGKESWSYAQSIKHMQKEEPELYENYKEARKSPLLRKELAKLLEKLPEHEKYSRMTCYTELDGMTTPLDATRNEEKTNRELRKRFENIL